MGLKIAIPCYKGGLDDKVADRFARAPCFTIVELDEKGDVKNVEIIQNPYAGIPHGAGPRAAELLASKGVRVYIGPSPGPNAYEALRRLGIEILTTQPGKHVREALEEYLKSKKG